MRSPFPARSRQAPQGGFSLAELIQVLAISALILAAALPGYAWLRENAHLVTRVNGLVADLYLVRSESFKRGAPVSLCRSADGESCASNGSWSQGWIAFTDPDRDRRFEPKAGEARIRHQQAQADHIRIDLSAFGSSGNVTYYPSGMTYDRNGTFTFCTPGGAARAVIFSRAGRVRVARKKPDGSALNCP